jgi:hypothetical protein
MREVAILPDEAHGIVTENRALLQRLLAVNIEAEKPKMAPDAIVYDRCPFSIGRVVGQSPPGLHIAALLKRRGATDAS